MLSKIFMSLVLLTFITIPTIAADWPQFRGPQGNGISTDSKVPTVWNTTKNIKWKMPLPRPGNGSPIVIAGKVFVTTAEDEQGQQRSLYCFDQKDGKQLWVRTVKIDKKMPTHKTNPYCGTTPASDGKVVVVWHASAGLVCYDIEGKKIWSRNLGEFRHTWGYGTSPLIYKDRVLLHSGPGKKILITALNLKDGNTLWQQEEPFKGTGNRNEDGKYMGSWSTPVITKVDGKDQMILMLPKRVNAYDPISGKILWSCDGLRHERGDLAYSSPVIAGDLCFVTGGYSGPSMAIRMGGSGNITEKARLWRKRKQPQNIGSGVFVGGYVYRANAGPGTIECWDPKSGKILWKDRAAGANHWGSIVAVAGNLMVINQKGITVVFKPNHKKFESIANNPLEESCNTTPAISNHQIYIRTDKHLFCIGE